MDILQNRKGYFQLDRKIGHALGVKPYSGCIITQFGVNVNDV